ncbi:unknown [Prevotella sp. CAG:5226]|nr:unknown [Prevotella sp. CAG:5226]
MLLTTLTNSTFCALSYALCTNVLPAGIHFMGGTCTPDCCVVKCQNVTLFIKSPLWYNSYALEFLICSDVFCS